MVGNMDEFGGINMEGLKRRGIFRIASVIFVKNQIGLRKKLIKIRVVEVA